MERHRTQPSLRPLRWMLGATIALFIGLGLFTTTDDRDERRTPSPGGGGTADHPTLQLDANMTERMSTPNADTARHRADAQLVRSQDPGYVAQLEQHQRDVDRMLARGGT